MMEQILGPMRLGLVLFVSMFAFDESVRVSYVEREIVLERLHACPKKDIDREQVLQTYFREAGCTGSALTLDQPQHSEMGNVVCTLPGASNQQILVGVHFDHAEVGAGAVDNWSGASLLPSLYQAVAAEPRKHIFVFVGFYGEEGG